MTGLQRLTLAKDVLAIHDAINEVLIIEDRAGESLVADEARRNQAATSDLLSDYEKNALLAPALILGAASQLTRRSGSARLVVLSYASLAVLLAPVDENRALLMTTSSSSVNAVMFAVQEALPGLLRKRASYDRADAVGSAEEAQEAARSFFSETRLCDPSRVHVGYVTLKANGPSWRVGGSFRPSGSLRSRRFDVDVNAQSGAVTNFESYSESNYLFAEIATLVAATGVVLWAIIVYLLR